MTIPATSSTGVMMLARVDPYDMMMQEWCYNIPNHWMCKKEDTWFSWSRTVQKTELMMKIILSSQSRCRDSLHKY